MCFLLSGCVIDKFEIKTKKDWEAEKAKLEQQYNEKVDQKTKELESKVKDKDEKESANLQKASGLAYGIMMLSEVKPEDQRTRPDRLINFKSKELVTRLPDLPAEDILKINDELKKELDEKNTTLIDLQKKYNDALAQAEKDKQMIAAIQKEIDIKKDELLQIEMARKDAKLALEAEQRKAAEILASKKAQEAADAAKKEEIIKYLIRIFVGIGVLAAVGAYGARSVILAAASAGAFALSVFVAFLEPWMVITGGCIIIAAIIAGIAFKWHQSHKAHLEEKDLSERLVGGIEEYKTKIDSSKFKETLGASIDEWIKDAPELKDKIKNKLKNLNLV